MLRRCQLRATAPPDTCMGRCPCVPPAVRHWGWRCIPSFPYRATGRRRWHCAAAFCPPRPVSSRNLNPNGCAPR